MNEATRKRKKAAGLCLTPRCSKEAKNGNYCHACVDRRWRERNPIKAIYRKLKSNAKRRGKVFTISVEAFTEFINSNADYVEKRGRKARSLHIDRIDETKGYEEGNLQILTNQANSTKYYDFAFGEDVRGQELPF